MLRKFRIKINDKEYMVEMEEIGAPAAPIAAAVPAAAVAPAAPLAAAPVAEAAPAPAAPPVSGNGTTMEAPMPGKVLKVLVKAGETVKENQPIIVLEAMKMENEIVAPKGGVLSAVYVNEGSAIDAGQPIATIE